MEQENEPKDKNNGRWTEEEHELFLLGLEQYGKDWYKVAELVNTRTAIQVRTHAQKFFLRMQSKQKNGSSKPEFSRAFSLYQKAWLYHNMCASYFFSLIQSSASHTTSGESWHNSDDSDSVIQSQELEEDNTKYHKL